MIPQRQLSTPVLNLDDPQTLPVVRALLYADKVFVAPTDTVFGLFCRYDSPAALARIYEAKGRPPQKAIPILIGAAEHLAQVIRAPYHPGADALMARFWPGPLTLVLPAQPHLPPVLTAGAPTVAVRMPAHPGLLRLLAALGPLAATSANRSGHAETHSVAQVLAQLDGRVDLILDDAAPPGHLPAAASPVQDAETAGSGAAPPLASTIVDLADRHAPPRILREGPLGRAVRELLASVLQDDISPDTHHG